MEGARTNLVTIELTNWAHAHELATVLDRAGMDPHYDPPCPASSEGMIGFGPVALEVPEEQAGHARELLEQWRMHAERRVDAIARDIWKETLPLALSMLALSLGITLLTGDLTSSSMASFFTFLLGGFWCAYRRRIRRQS